MKFCDVLIVGGGGGALRAAIAAKEKNPQANVMLMTKGVLGKSGVTATACSDRMAFHATLEHTEPGGSDAWRFHADDIYRIGGKVSDYDLAEVLAHDALEAFAYLDKLGVPFVRKNGIPDQFVTDGSDYARACYTGPKTAVHIETALFKRFSELNIEVLEHTMAAKLVVKNGNVVGVLAVDTNAREANAQSIFGISSPAVILATGGGGLIYENNVFPGGMTGDGMAIAYEVGAELVNMEFIQIGIASVKTKFNCSGSMMRAIPRLINENGEEILEKYLPQGTSKKEIFNIMFAKGASWPVSYEHKTHIVDIALYKEKMAGHRVYLDYSQNPAGFDFALLTSDNQQRYAKEQTVDMGSTARTQTPLARLKEINQDSIQWFLERGIDLEKGDLIEVAACAQHFQGGVKIDRFARTSVPGLWAIGETAGGQHGANRPGGNALLDCQVFGKIAGEDAAQKVLTSHADAASAVVETEQENLIQYLKAHHQETPNVMELRQAIQKILEKSAGIVRTESGLAQGLREIDALKKLQSGMAKLGPAYYLETLNMLCVSEIVLLAAYKRNESRGPHLRFALYEDNVPVSRNDDIWEKYIVVYQHNQQPDVKVQVPVTPVN